MARTSEPASAAIAKEQWEILVVCEEELCHARALSLCERLVQQFWDDMEFRFSWWLFTNLDYNANAEDAAAAATRAEIILFATESEGELPDRVKSWIETWVNRRLIQGGALICFTADDGTLTAQASPKRFYLRQVAHRAQMDFLSDIPEHLGPILPESPNWFSERAGTMGPVMDGILRQTGTPHPPQLQ